MPQKLNIAFYPKKEEDVGRLLNIGILENDFNVTITSDPKESDILICVDEYPPIFPMYKTILLQRETPLTDHRIWTYKNFGKFHTAITHSPMGENQFKFTEHPEVYPWNPFPGQDRIRKDTEIKTRILFYAGQNYDAFAKVPDQFPDITTLYDVRAQLVKDLSKYPNFKVYGANWPKEVNAVSGISTKYIYGPEYTWDFYNRINLNKFLDIDNSEADFVLVLENSILPNLIAEKIHDGFISDRVVLYLGEQNIEKHIPQNCYVDLRPFFNRKDKTVNAAEVMNIVNGMPQEKYDEYITNARAWRKTLFGKWEEERDKLTRFIAERIKSKAAARAIKPGIDGLKAALKDIRKTSKNL